MLLDKEGEIFARRRSEATSVLTRRPSGDVWDRGPFRTCEPSKGAGFCQASFSC